MLKIGILGTGFMGGTYAAAFAWLRDVQIVGISSRSAEKAAASSRSPLRSRRMKKIFGRKDKAQAS
jgi:predicted dehydrogenase